MTIEAKGDVSLNGKKLPRVRFCWNCSKQLYGNHHREIEHNGRKYIVHAQCEKEAKETLQQCMD